jgi:hypothetical protein
MNADGHRTEKSDVVVSARYLHTKRIIDIASDLGIARRTSCHTAAMRKRIHRKREKEKREKEKKRK